MNHGSLFSGIGGFDLAAEWIGWKNKFHCEWNEFGAKVLQHYWPNAKHYHDITKTDFTIWRGKIDVLTGGFPCQPYSSAGKRKGKEDERHLWPEMLRAIREISPTWVVGENVLGLTNWNGGLVFEEVCIELEAQGYQVQPFILPAASVNAPHRRDRVWFVAYSDLYNDRRITRENERESKEKGLQERDSVREPSQSGEIFGASSDPSGERNTSSRKSGEAKKEGSDWIKGKGERRSGSQRIDGLLRLQGNASDPNSSMRERRAEGNQPQGRSKPNDQQLRGRNKLYKSNFEEFPSQPSLCGGNDGLPTKLDGITFPKWRNESIKAYGNAVVPQVVYQIFKAIQAYENQ